MISKRMMLRWMSPLFLLVFAVGCQQNNPQPQPTPQPQPPLYFIDADIDGVNWYAQQSSNGCDMAYKHWHLEDQLNDLIEIDYLTGFEQNGWTTPITTQLNGNLNVGFSRFTEVESDYNLYESVFHNSLANVSTAFYEDGSSSPGVEIWYYDSSGDWSTRYGSQAGSTFTITENEEMVGYTFPTRQISGTFSGTLYLETDPQQTKIVTNGAFTLHYQQIQP